MLSVTTLLLISSVVAGVGAAAIPPGEGETPSATGSLDGTDGAATVDSENDTGESTAELTLITGDTVVIDDRGSETDYRLKDNTSAAIYETRTGTYVVPTRVNTTRFSKELFNVELLRGQNQTDAETADIPLIVEWANTTSMDRGVGARFRDDVTRKRLLEMMNGSAVSVSKDDAGSVYRFLAGTDAVESVHYNARYRGMASDPRETVDAAEARQRFNVSGDGVTVAVLDSGVDEAHPDIGDDEIGEVNFVSDGPVRDVLDHGTPVAGVITGDGTAANGSHLGVAPEANVLDVRVLGRDNVATEDTLIKGIDHAIRQDVDVISMSLGKQAGDPRADDPFHDQIERAAANDISVVTTTGNVRNAPGTGVMTPGIHEDGVTVGASGNGSRVAPQSRRGPTPQGRYVKPDLVAPGVGVTSPSAESQGYVTENGTSFSTPFVSGAVALLVEKHPGWSEQRIKNVLTVTADPLGSDSVYAQGSGNLNVSAALDPGIVVDPATIDFGSVPLNTTVSQTVTVRNLASETRRGNVSVRATPLEGGPAGTVATNRTSLALAPGETVGLELTVDTTDAVERPHSGRLRIADANAIFGYDPTRNVTVRKRGLGTVSNDSITLVHERSGRDYGPREFTDGTAAFDVADPGEYVAISTGEHDGQPVVTVKSTTVEVSGMITLDETETVRQTLDAGSLPGRDDGLHNETLVVNATLNQAPYDDRVVVDDPHTATVRVSPSSAVTVAIRRILTSPSDARGYNASTVYHLRDVVRSPSASRAVSVGQLHRQDVRYYRGTPGETYRATLAAADFDDVGLSESRIAAGIGTTVDQTIYVSPSIAQYHDSFAVGPFGFTDWFATPQSSERLVDFDGGQSVTTAIRKHPYRSTVERWFLTEQAFDATVFPTVGQPPNGYAIDDGPDESYDLWVNGEHVTTETKNDRNASISHERDGIESVRLRVRDRHDMSPLSNDTITTFAAAPNGSDSRPPTVPSVSFESHGRTNVIPNGSVDVTVSTSDRDGAVRNATLYVTTRDGDGVPTSTPFENATGWEQVPLSDTGGGTYEATLDLGAYRGTLGVGLRAVDEAGNYVETTATDGVVVGSRTPTANLTANRTLVESGDTVRLDASDSYDDLAVATYQWDLDGDGRTEETTREPTLTHRYTETGGVEPTVAVADEHGFDNASHPIAVAVATEIPPRADDLDTRTTADVQTAVEAGRTRVASDRVNGGLALDSGSMFIARGDVNGGIEANDGTTVVVETATVNGEAVGHNVLAANARFNGAIDADGTVTAALGSATVRGGVEADEAVRVLADGRLTVRGDVDSETLVVGENATLVVTGEVEADRLVAQNGSNVRLDGRLACTASSVDPDATVRLRGNTDCGDIVKEGPRTRGVNTERTVTVTGGESLTTGSTPAPSQTRTGTRSDPVVDAESGASETTRTATDRPGRPGTSTRTQTNDTAASADQPDSRDTETGGTSPSDWKRTDDSSDGFVSSNATGETTTGKRDRGEVGDPATPLPGDPRGTEADVASDTPTGTAAG